MHTVLMHVCVLKCFRIAIYLVCQRAFLVLDLMPIRRATITVIMHVRGYIAKFSQVSTSY